MKNLLYIFYFIISMLYAKDVTTKLKYIGTPYLHQYQSEEDTYSRNVWDLQIYNNLLFIGAGNSANEGPSINSGPVYLKVYNPKTNKFSVETKINDDQIDIFKILNNHLLIPGHDATASWDWGNFYMRLKNNKWHQYRNIPKALHVYDLVIKDKKLFAAIGLNEGAAVGITTDMGKHWNIIKLGRSRVYNFLNIGDEFYAIKKFKRTSSGYFSVAQYINGKFMPRYDVSIYDIFPDTKFIIKYSRMIRAISFDKRAIYIGAYKYNSHQTKPFGLYWIKNNAHKIDIKHYIPHDILRRDNKLYVLVSEEIDDKTTNIKVLEFNINNLSTYKELFSFKYGTFARSFELLNGKFYFGMGSDVDEGNHWKMSDIKKETGDIIIYDWKIYDR